MRIELLGLHAPVTGSTKEIARAIAETLAGDATGIAIDGPKKADVDRVIGEILGASGPLVRAPGGAAREADILFNNVGT
jgi:NAD(P)-dependent dehydrogenase (short-subunit alcohol dehydrogenase family)